MKYLKAVGKIVIILFAIFGAMNFIMIMDPVYVKRYKGEMVASDLKSIDVALKMYYLDNGFFPTTEQGFLALVKLSNIEPVPKFFRNAGYLIEVPQDPWGDEYRYVMSVCEDDVSPIVWSDSTNLFSGINLSKWIEKPNHLLQPTANASAE